MLKNEVRIWGYQHGDMLERGFVCKILGEGQTTYGGAVWTQPREVLVAEIECLFGLLDSIGIEIALGDENSEGGPLEWTDVTPTPDVDDGPLPSGALEPEPFTEEPLPDMELF